MPSEYKYASANDRRFSSSFARSLSRENWHQCIDKYLQLEKNVKFPLALFHRCSKCTILEAIRKIGDRLKWASIAGSLRCNKTYWHKKKHTKHTHKSCGELRERVFVEMEFSGYFIPNCILFHLYGLSFPLHTIYSLMRCGKVINMKHLTQNTESGWQHSLGETMMAANDWLIFLIWFRYFVVLSPNIFTRFFPLLYNLSFRLFHRKFYNRSNKQLWYRERSK